MFGKRLHAQQVFDWTVNVAMNDGGLYGNHQTDRDLPEGFKNLSEGSSCARVALMHVESEVVYKTDCSDGRYGTHLGTAQEYLVGRELWRRYPDGIVNDRVRIPRVGMFSFRNGDRPWCMVSMQAVLGTEEESFQDGDHMKIRDVGLRDMHSDNYRYGVDGFVYPIDLGSDLRDWDSPLARY